MLVPSEQVDLILTPGYYNPAGAYLATLSTDKSQESAIWGLKVASFILADTELYLSTPWVRLGVPEANHLRSQVMKRYKFTSANLVLATVRGVVKQCFELEQIDANQKDRVLTALRNVKGKNSPTGRLVTPEEITRILETCEGVKGIRDRAMIYTAYSLGLRRSEVGSVLFEDLNITDCTLTIAGAKGNKTQVQYLSTAAMGYIMEWLEVRGTAPGALFSNVLKGGRIGKGITPRGYSEALNTARILAGVPHFSTHDLRRSAITRVALEKDIYTAQNFARHEDIKTTLGYIRAANLEADLKSASDLF